MSHHPRFAAMTAKLDRNVDQESLPQPAPVVKRVAYTTDAEKAEAQRVAYLAFLVAQPTTYDLNTLAGCKAFLADERTLGATLVRSVHLAAPAVKVTSRVVIDQDKRRKAIGAFVKITHVAGEPIQGGTDAVKLDNARRRAMYVIAAAKDATIGERRDKSSDVALPVAGAFVPNAKERADLAAQIRLFKAAGLDSSLVPGSAEAKALDADIAELEAQLAALG